MFLVSNEFLGIAQTVYLTSYLVLNHLQQSIIKNQNKTTFLYFRYKIYQGMLQIFCNKKNRIY